MHATGTWTAFCSLAVLALYASSSCACALAVLSCSLSRSACKAGRLTQSNLYHRICLALLAATNLAEIGIAMR